jgi:hypothetical protein
VLLLLQLQSLLLLPRLLLLRLLTLRLLQTEPCNTCGRSRLCPHNYACTASMWTCSSITVMIS